MQIIELELLSSNLAETERFYKRVLGLKAELSDKFSVTFAIGYTKLIFRYAEGLNPVYHFAIDIPNNRFDQAYSIMKSRIDLIPIEKENDIADFTNWDAQSFYFYDNNGNILEFITRYPNRETSTHDFNSKSYLSISEVGLVTNDVPRLADQLKKEFGVPIFHRQPRGSKFTVSGDDQGLFIIAAKGRDWYPTKVKSASFRTRVLFMNEGNLYHIVR
ncbi:glyoxalase [Flavobacterium alkalisoli]|uniref:Glyoxalase n=1 Tax=Flavobacterium alkalisoli TaxID=2602769 RepID=A0A5B9FS28_9FLAO|nr:glyoxalase [Flavobacterium alkalisoli]QEE50183.1 glyoxalase [Flavobacterium alkalisoli]